MKLPRLSIAGLMVAVVLISIGIVALAHPSIIWASFIFTATVALLATATLAAIVRRGRARIAWAGAALFGWLYFAMSFGPIPNTNGALIPPFPTHALYEYIRSVQMSADSDRTAKTGASTFRPNTLPPGESILLTYPHIPPLRLFPPRPVAPVPAGLPLYHLDWINLRRIVHSLGAIVFASLGGLIGGRLARHDDPSTPSERESTPG